MNEPLGRLGSLRPGPGAADRLRHGGDGALLADDPLVQLALHVDELLRLLLGELVDGDARPHAEHLGDRLLVDLVEQVDAVAADLGLLGRLLLEQRLLLVAQAPGLLEALLLDGRLLGLLDLVELELDLAQVGRRGHALDAQAAAGLVDEVDRLVGQVAVGDVAVGEVGRGDERLVGDRDPVVGLVLVAEALEDLDRVGERRLVDLDRLEAAFEGGVLLDVLAVLVERGGADRLQLAAGEHRLEDRRRVDRPFGGAGADEGVDLVDEQQDVAAALDLLEHLLEALLEVAAVAAAGDEGAEVERVQLLAAQRVGHVVVDDHLGEALDDGGLADAGLADQHRVVLRAPGQDLHDPLDLAAAADHRVELVLAGELGEVAAELVEDLAVAALLAAGLLLGRAADGRRRLGGALGAAAGALVAGQQLDDLLAHPGQVGAELDEHLGGDALALTDEAEEDVLGADVVVAELQRLAQRQLEDLLRPWRERDVPGRRRAALADHLLDLAAHRFEGDAQALQRLRRDAFALVDQPEEDVLGPDVRVVEQARFLLGENHHSAGSVGEAFEHWRPFSWGRRNLSVPAPCTRIRTCLMPPPSVRSRSSPSPPGTCQPPGSRSSWRGPRCATRRCRC